MSPHTSRLLKSGLYYELSTSWPFEVEEEEWMISCWYQYMVPTKVSIISKNYISCK